MRNPLNHYCRFPVPVNIPHLVSPRRTQRRGYPATFILFLPRFPLSLAPFLSRWRAAVRSRERGGDGEQDPTRSHPIERSRRTEPNAPNAPRSSTSRERGQNRDKPDRRPRLGATRLSVIPIVNKVAAVISRTRDTSGKSQRGTVRFSGTTREGP